MCRPFRQRHSERSAAFFGGDSGSFFTADWPHDRPRSREERSILMRQFYTCQVVDGNGQRFFCRPTLLLSFFCIVENGARTPSLSLGSSFLSETFPGFRVSPFIASRVTHYAHQDLPPRAAPQLSGTVARSFVPGRGSRASWGCGAGPLLPQK